MANIELCRCLTPERIGFMLFYTGLLFLVIAVSIDGFGVGVTYGMRNIRVPFVALLIIMCCSGLVVLLSMTIGEGLSGFISPKMTKIIGASILIFLGLFSLCNILRSQLGSQTVREDEQANGLTDLRKVITTPDQADLDKSGIITPGEALLLGAALALDAFGAGIGAAIVGYSPVITPLLVALMSGMFLYSGIKLGGLLAKSAKLQRMSFIPPLLLISLGILNLF
ncbi:sporulation membrane protein YtaF [Virgibacillus sp. 179-BFC.A HS]|uniref:Sporulation membrane protein YtaF n=1 Tax=Tigheibacillus jepli TaxID=3035914 RepID=A0ABU5CF99_9BACI|nr:sporulation membrane protein YtaF [Virgibacillus sp. 179-BFC.A HS]MDY0405007.1 sporulation membrane protein YtaF [Virgibacillus sp. 179-BFC.A HS]